MASPTIGRDAHDGGLTSFTVQIDQDSDSSDNSMDIDSDSDSSDDSMDVDPTSAPVEVGDVDIDAWDHPPAEAPFWATASRLLFDIGSLDSTSDRTITRWPWTTIEPDWRLATSDLRQNYGYGRGRPEYYYSISKHFPIVSRPSLRNLFYTSLSSPSPHHLPIISSLSVSPHLSPISFISRNSFIPSVRSSENLYTRARPAIQEEDSFAERPWKYWPHSHGFEAPLYFLMPDCLTHTASMILGRAHTIFYPKGPTPSRSRFRTPRARKHRMRLAT